MRRRLDVAIALGGALLAALLLVGFAPAYLRGRGFPLDDAWIHMVYARSVARSFTLAYDPGIPATGETAPLWALLAAAVHDSPFACKLLGLALHATTVFVALRVLEREPGVARSTRIAGALLVAASPDLVAAAVSGMEVPLATLFACLLLISARSGPRTLFLVAFLAPFARPELAVLTLSLHALYGLSSRRRRARALLALVATCASFAALSIRNLLVSGRPLPATFYAKFAQGHPSLLEAQTRGFGELLPQVGLGPWLFAFVALAAWMTTRRRTLRLDAGAVLVATAFVIASFVAIFPGDPAAFYHQRYVLPALPLFLLALPVLAARALRPRLALALVALPLLVAALARSPERMRHLENDAHNIDDVQVALGKALSNAPADSVVWAVDAGAVRYFGNAFVVDMVGLNTPALLGPGADDYLRSHPASLIELVSSWSTVDRASRQRLAGRGLVVRPSTPYTVTSYPFMAEHHLLPCVGLPLGTYTIRGVARPLVCAR